MTTVVTQKCIGCRDLACIDVCPTECFHIGPKMVYIDPDVCISCGACEPACPTEAIYHQDDLPTEFADDLGLNAQMVLQWPNQVDVKS